MNMTVNNNRVNNIATQPILTIKAEQQAEVRRLTSEITQVKNSIDELNISIKSSKSLVNKLKSIEDKHGGDSSVRLKGNNYKPGEGDSFIKNMFNGGRYQMERQKAATELGATGAEISASKAVKSVKDAISTNEATWKTKNLELDTKTLQKEQLLKQIQTPTAGSQKTGNVTTAKTRTDKSDAQATKIRKDFSLIYQSNAGCKALNAEARYQFGQGEKSGNLNASKVISEYQSAKGDDVFSGGNKDIKGTISACVSNLPDMVRAAADAWYTPGGSNMHTFRGQGMTTAGLNTLVAQFKKDQDQVYKPGQFFSTSENRDVAKEFANNSSDEVRVIFEIKGNSAKGITVGNGLSFGNKATEREKLYSPKANFKVNNIVRNSGEGVYKIQLEEVAQKQNAKLLPY